LKKLGRKPLAEENPEEHQTRLDLYNQGLIDQEIADKLYLCTETIRHWRTKYNLPPNGGLSKEDQKERLRLYKAGWNDSQIAKLMGVSSRAIWGWRGVRNLPPNESYTKGGMKKRGRKPRLPKM